MTFLCVVCKVNEQSTTKHIKRFKLCLNCYSEINDDYRRTRPTKPKHHTKCIYCGIEINTYQLAPTCQRHRTRWYKDSKSRKELESAIKSKNTGFLSNTRIGKVLRFGFDMKLIIKIISKDKDVKKIDM